MPSELGTRDVVEQLDTRLGHLEEGQRDLRTEMVTRFAQVDSRIDQLRGEMTTGFSELRGEFAAGLGALDRRIGRQNGVLVSVLLGLVVGVGGLWLK